MKQSLLGKNALVCGASRGIGAAIAGCLAKQGARVTLLSRNKNQLIEVAQSLASVSEPHLCAEVDLANRVSVAEFLSEIGPQKSFPFFDILINNTGGPPSGALAQAGVHEFEKAFSAHLFPAQALALHLFPYWKEKRWGRVVNVLSTSVRIPIAGLGVSNTVRAAMASWAKTWAAELAPWGVTMNNVLPGYTNTERFEELATNAAIRADISIEAQKEIWLKTVPMQRFAAPEEVASAVCYFASMEASYVTGQSLAVDGGRIGAV
jgi:3-oxoacyl-[acyl-carrier protein] reductase